MKTKPKNGSSTMTMRDRMLTVVQGRNTDRVPFAMSSHVPAAASL